MIPIQQRIAESLERQFAEMGFATQGVEALRAGADVSLRTLYKYFPSREAMVVGALDHRDQAYSEWIDGGPEKGADHVLYPLLRLGDWLNQVANTGCLFMNALSAYPESTAIQDAVLQHKLNLRNHFIVRLHHVAPDCDATTLANEMMLLHEGLTEAARLFGQKTATQSALRSGRSVLLAAGIE
ncbi:TetR/AcrR family transcriptional regulator [Ruegeria sp. ANG10]|uniref:TetR/AcrR family transcriptional regulator n=1 Tax=Ruegeria sp. ANG10 TaxID=3042467 RepID=UPI0034515AE0